MHCQIFLAFAAGIWLGFAHPLSHSLLAGLIIPTLAAVLCAASLFLLWKQSAHILSRLFGFTVIGFLGYLFCSYAKVGPEIAKLRLTSGKRCEIEGLVCSLPKTQHGHFRFLLDVSRVEKQELEQGYGRCQVFVKCSEAGEQPAFGYGDRVSVLAELEEVAVPANAGQFDYRAYLLRHGTLVTAYAVSEKSVRVLTASPSAIWRTVARVRTRVTNELRSGLPPDLAELGVSVVYGDKITDLSEETIEEFRRAGLTHILVASGTQVSLLIAMLGLLSVRLHDNQQLSGRLINLALYLGTMLVVLLYAAIAGFETSILRAVGMGALLLTGRLLSREIDGLSALALSGLAILVGNPLELMAPGFQLSFAATFGLIYVAGLGFPLLDGMGSFFRLVLQTVITTGGAQLFVTPVMLASFHQLSLTAVFSNTVAIPLAFMLLVVGGLYSLGLAHIPLLGQLVSWVVYGLTFVLRLWAHIFSGFSLSQLHTPQVPWWWMSALVSGLLLAGEWFKNRQAVGERLKQRLFISITMICLILLAGLLHWWLVPQPQLTALALGQGRGPARVAYIWRSGAGRTALLLSGRGLDKQHNGDTVTAALAVRGVNRLHALCFVDGTEPAPEIWSFPQSRAVSAGQALPAQTAMSWLVEDDEVFGAECRLGRQRIWVVWARPYYLLRRDSETDRSTDCDLLLIDAALWDGLSIAQQRALSDRAEEVVVQRGVEAVSRKEEAASQVSQYAIQAGSEVLVRLNGGRLDIVVRKAKPPAADGPD